MTPRLFASVALAGVACLGLTSNVLAGEESDVCGQEPGSLLVYPIFDNTRGTWSALTVTNTNDDVVSGSILVEFIYISDEDCLEFNRTHLLTANDTLTVLPKVHNPNMVRGYAYAFAKDPATGAAVKWDHLIGTNIFLQSFGVYDFEVNAITFQAGNSLEEGDETDLDGDGVKDFDGLEYCQSPDVLMIPRFFGNNAAVQTELVLIGLTGARFETIVDFLIYNDNEEVFSGQHSFDCWERTPLLQISGVFARSFLRSTNHDGNEVQGAPLEAGWYKMDGHVAFSTNTSVQDPAFLALQIERLVGGQPVEGSDDVLSDGAVASLPFSKGGQDNGGLLSLSILGNQ